MRAAVLHGVGEKLTVGAHPRPVPGPGQALVRVRAAGVCHTDLHLAGGVPTSPPLPLVLGHEIAGEVVEVGGGSAESGVKPGQRVLVYYYDGCLQCDWCSRGLENMCRTPASKWGFDSDGGFAEYFLASVRCLVPLADEVPFAEAAVLGCSGTTAVHVLRTVAGLEAGEMVVVLGAGGIGLATVQVAVAGEATVIAVDPHGDSRDAATGYGAAAAFDPASRALASAVLQATGGRGADVVVDTVGNTVTTGLAVQLARPQGRVVLVGYTAEDASLDVATVVTKEISVRGSVGATLAEARQVAEMAAAGTLRGSVAGEYRLDEVNKALGRLAGGSVVGRLLIVP
jgi:D-arabinose 1-dehydrogenase-like Zn-dependent alcohol dehydrogenase